MKTKQQLIYSLSLTLLLGLFSTVNAQAVRNHVERAQDRNQISNDNATIQRDRAEIQQFRGYRAGLLKAVGNGNAGAARGHHIKLVRAMEREVNQSNAKVSKSVNELQQSKAEVRSDNREIRRDVSKRKPYRAANDRKERQDDVRDLADDRNDLNEVRRRAARQQEILSVFKGIKFVDNPNVLATIKAKKSLMDEFEQTMVRDMGENWEELKEDKRELREDRRQH
ncbi:MAG TPA: hypothetical protein ENJ82_15965 [Bacteroidetes bacterium]|nr:hypothetical protein [Bacteroidota bacterium]